MLLGFAIVVIGTFLTWSDNPPFSESGLGSTSGIFALIAAAGAGLIGFFDRQARGSIIAVSSAALILIAIIVEYLDISSSSATAGAGIYVALAGAVVAAIAAGLFAFRQFKQPAEPAALARTEEPAE